MADTDITKAGSATSRAEVDIATTLRQGKTKKQDIHRNLRSTLTQARASLRTTSSQLNTLSIETLKDQSEKLLNNVQKAQELLRQVKTLGKDETSISLLSQIITVHNREINFVGRRLKGSTEDYNNVGRDIRDLSNRVRNSKVSLGGNNAQERMLPMSINRVGNFVINRQNRVQTNPVPTSNPLSANRASNNVTMRHSQTQIRQESEQREWEQGFWKSFEHEENTNFRDVIKAIKNLKPGSSSGSGFSLPNLGRGRLGKASALAKGAATIAGLGGLGALINSVTPSSANAGTVDNPSPTPTPNTGGFSNSKADLGVTNSKIGLDKPTTEDFLTKLFKYFGLSGGGGGPGIGSMGGSSPFGGSSSGTGSGSAYGGGSSGGSSNYSPGGGFNTGGASSSALGAITRNRVEGGSGSSNQGFKPTVLGSGNTKGEFSRTGPGYTDPKSFQDPSTNPNVNQEIIKKYGQSGRQLPVVIRNNNPAALSLMKPGSNEFAERQEGYVGATPRPANEGGYYAKYATPEHGVAANAKLLERYGTQGVNTPDAIVRKWSVDPNAHVAYSRTLQKALGVDGNTPLDLNDKSIQAKILAAKSGHESGTGQPIYSRETFERGVNRDFSGGKAGAPEATTVMPQGIKEAPNVIERQAQLAEKRKLPIKAELKEQLQYAAEKTGVQVEIGSGGQAAIGSAGPRTGSTRHDDGGAADIKLYQTNEKGERRLLNMNNPQDAAIMQKFTTESMRAGATGVGAGQGYMGASTLHIGGGSVASWGGAPWIPQAFEEGKEVRKNGRDQFEAWQKARAEAAAKKDAPTPKDSLTVAKTPEDSSIFKDAKAPDDLKSRTLGSQMKAYKANSEPEAALTPKTDDAGSTRAPYTPPAPEASKAAPATPSSTPMANTPAKDSGSGEAKSTPKTNAPPDIPSSHGALGLNVINAPGVA